MLRTSLLLLCCACAGASGANVGSAVVATAVATTAAAVSRANGGCWASCPPGTLCVPRTGLCEPLPCRGLCGADQVCVGAGLEERCSARTGDVRLDPDPLRPAYLPPPINLPPPAPVAPPR